MKRIFCIFVLMVSSLFIFVGCGSSNTSINVDKADTKMEVESKNNETIIEEAQEEVVLFDNGEVKIVAKELAYDSIFGSELKLCIENNSDVNIIVQNYDEVNVNDYTVSSIMSTDVNAHKKAVGEITFLNLDECGIEEIKQVEANFVIIDADSWEYLYITPVTTVYFN